MNFDLHDLINIFSRLRYRRKCNDFPRFFLNSNIKYSLFREVRISCATFSMRCSFQYRHQKLWWNFGLFLQASDTDKKFKSERNQEFDTIYDQQVKQKYVQYRLGPIFPPTFFLRVVFPPKFSSQTRIHLGFNPPRIWFSWDNKLPLIIYPTHKSPKPQ